MKKILLIGALLLLTGCSDSQSVFTTYEQNESKESTKGEKEEIVLPEVVVHSPNGNSNGYVVRVDKNKKYIATVASSVSTHPRALIETSTGQIVEGEVIGVNKEANIAILFTKLTAPIEAFTLNVSVEKEPSLQVSEAMINDDNELLAITSIVNSGTGFIKNNVPSNAIESLLKSAMKTPISYEERIELKEYFASYPKVMVADENIIETYDKETFSYNPDELLLFINDFHKSLNRYFETKNDSDLSSFVASDDLKMTIQQLANQDGGMKQFGSVKLISTKKEDFQYIVEGKTSLTVGDEVGVLKGIFKCIVMNGEWKITSATYE